MNSLGICIGATTLSAVAVNNSEAGIKRSLLHLEPHDGNPRQAFLDLFSSLPIDHYDRIAVTGRKFRSFVNLTSLPEPQAVETALTFVCNGNVPLNAVISAGGETFLIYVLGKDGKICSVQTGNKCASGTGEFFLQQIRRLDLGLEEAIAFARQEQPYKVSGRCSVFCKSDCTHATNKGIPKRRIASGLCEMMSGKILEILRHLPRSNMMLIGGSARNTVMVDYLKKEISSLIIPEEAAYFEALGCALWALEHETLPAPASESVIRQDVTAFHRLPPLADFLDKVDFRTMEQGIAREGDACILGLDVGSTTTKAVLLRQEDNRILASVYLRTNGNPVGASRACYAALYEQLGPLAEKISIKGLGVTGSGRQIAGLHAMTEGIINEIIAHATGALFFDSTVDTIFEIGGQDAKYTYVKDGIPSDYAMNDACSAGTGSFLEEAAWESMGVAMEDIAGIALRGKAPPNFNDQCAAFISSDIKNAAHEGMSREDIVSGLVYSICMNYSNRVKGNRTMGNNIFMQGGVCYNRAIPVAMAALTGKRIVVPPEPGLMGAFGVALEIKKRLEHGILKESSFDLLSLKNREIAYESPFVCNGGKEHCDRKCEIARIRIEDKVNPFGGACNRWYNLRYSLSVDAESLDRVKEHASLTFQSAESESQIPSSDRISRSVGINRSFLTHSYYPLYQTFFSRLGFSVLLPDSPRPEGMISKGTAFCYPAELAHGFFYDLLHKKPDFLFLPHIRGMYVEGGNPTSTICPISQGEPYYLASTFNDREEFRRLKEADAILQPVLDFSQGYGAARTIMVNLARSLGCGKKDAEQAFSAAVALQEQVVKATRDSGREFLSALEEEGDRYGIVIFGRAYNAFVPEANLGIPRKFASRGVGVVPLTCLPLADESVDDSMYWASGQHILKGAAFVARHPQLFGCYITNFSCGPDSFLLGSFRQAMGNKPFLILELDSHVADAGLETRIEAFLDIIRNYRELYLKQQRSAAAPSRETAPARVDHEDFRIDDSHGISYSLSHPRVHLVFPSMGRFHTDAIAAIFRSAGVRATALADSDEEVLKLGRGNTSCKECLPLQLTVGSLLKYLRDRKEKEELLVYFMPTAGGPCRFGQYSQFMKAMIERLGIPDVTLYSLNAANSYEDLNASNLTLKIWTGIVLADRMEDIYGVLLSAARDRDAAITVFQEERRKLLSALEVSPELKALRPCLEEVAARLKSIPLKRRPAEIPTILLTGEIFVRHDDLSRQYLIESLADQGFATKVASVMEWIYYTDLCNQKGWVDRTLSAKDKVSLFLRSTWMKKYERTISKVLAKSDLIPDRQEDVPHLVEQASPVLNPLLLGEAVLTVGAALVEVPDPYCGVIALGPFGCMPNRVSEAILTPEMNRGKRMPRKRSRKKPGSTAESLQNRPLPFLAIESDGNPFPQIIQAKLEVFLLQAARIHDLLHAPKDHPFD
ncbi:CoA-substrate-specific enzyme activase, putative [Syntrophus gentianae]|uniref:CoA-substrate-specific enzyme activase, putative n=1 Tax=Syntrophus gentianae TaxID=43775 RepID=A0A1H7WG92_9BACT|nr:acyl-CoA dehydratase activase [Syntrophus gentianae]SEM20576.1 CoA-substrate-specific enzyme activase, putative [Syntrophus gentianae]